MTAKGGLEIIATYATSWHKAPTTTNFKAIRKGGTCELKKATHLPKTIPVVQPDIPGGASHISLLKPQKAVTWPENRT